MNYILNISIKIYSKAARPSRLPFIFAMYYALESLSLNNPMKGRFLLFCLSWEKKVALSLSHLPKE